MYEQKQSAPFLAELKPSKKLLGLSFGFHFIALVACLLNALPFIIKLTVAAFIMLSLWISYRRVKSESCKISYTEKTGWQISGGNGFESVEILGSTVVTIFVVFLHLKHKPPIIIAYDALDDKEYRKLIVKLKMTFR